LIRKSPGRSHEGEWIGLGGKLEVGEDPVSSAVREFKEESGLILGDPKLRGTFVGVDYAKCGIIHIVIGTRWSGTVSESDEGELRWHSIQDLATLEGLARHQLLFLDRRLLDNDHF
jgi:8-oxo-dGTP diphosphatase